MKFDRNKTFPYPVLRPFSDDYVDVEFQTNVDFSSSEGAVTTDISYRVSSAELIEQVKNGNAKFVSIVSCRETYFREVIASDVSTSLKYVSRQETIETNFALPILICSINSGDDTR